MFTIERAVTVSDAEGHSQATRSFRCFYNGSEWECRCHIPGADPVERRVLGEDALHSLHLAIRLSDLMIELAEARGTFLWWTTHGDRCRLREVLDNTSGSEPETPFS